ncbi:hypothetical protein H0A36_15875 [Endozoicomonas sp. SM1973]|uniref:DUF5680 domain-containing protein n=1 Tax=Spartinivicinus marinus TaxID=2994442 RepID=A0A853IIP8_9GAMM|nr:DUF5680 domain-containing protein [Spartinivicinus marinus]MCX4029834.1 DUF5680 domain-containing protein [Spartinivicinus marinus]NYZ67496.1 hypothetical protein [Spartinivicinus marinus]
MDHDGLVAFLQSAKSTGYQWIGGNEGQPCRDQSRQFLYTEGDYHYRDHYFGYRQFGGEEVVWLNQQPIWQMLYFGHIIQSQPCEPVFTFLQEALQQPDANLPLRGPEQLNQAQWQYHLIVEGKLQQFQGVEEVSLDGQLVYQLRLIGGYLK